MRRLTRILAAVLAAGALLALAPGALAASTTLTGVVQLLHADAPTEGAPAQYFYALDTTDGRYRLQPRRRRRR